MFTYIEQSEGEGDMILRQDRKVANLRTWNTLAIFPIALILFLMISFRAAISLGSSTVQERRKQCTYTQHSKPPHHHTELCNFNDTHLTLPFPILLSYTHATPTTIRPTLTSRFWRLIVVIFTVNIQHIHQHLCHCMDGIRRCIDKSSIQLHWDRSQMSHTRYYCRCNTALPGITARCVYTPT